MKDNIDRFKQIIKNKVKSNLSKYISSDHIIGQQNGDLIKIPIKKIDLPKFIFGSNKTGGSSEGLGDIGDQVGDSDKKSDKSKAGNSPEEHDYVTEFTPDQLAEILGEELQLPNIEDKHKGKTTTDSSKYTNIRSVGPEGLKNFKRTFKNALKRQLSDDNYDPKNPIVIPIKDDKRFKSNKITEKPQSNTAIIFIRDISGSITESDRNICKSLVFWIELWLRKQHKDSDTRFLVYDTESHEVSRDQFYSASEGGGTQISSTLSHVAHLIKEEYPISDNNVYIFLLTDGDNLSYDDNDLCLKILKTDIIPNCNMFNYGQVREIGQFFVDIDQELKKETKVSAALIRTKDDILAAIKHFLSIKII